MDLQFNGLLIEWKLHSAKRFFNINVFRYENQFHWNQSNNLGSDKFMLPIVLKEYVRMYIVQEIK